MQTNEFNITRARKDTLACNDIIHFNNAGSSLMPIPVGQALHEYLDSEERIGGYEAEAQYHDSLEHIYDATAALLNCSSDEVAFVENATRAWDLAFYSFKFAPGDKILTAVAEYGSNVIAYLQQAKRYGVEIVFVPNDEYGQIDTQALEKLIDDKVKLISITHIPTGGGLVNPAKEIGRIAKTHNIPYILDTCQSVGHIPVDVEEIGCDVASITGRKYLRGPRGTGLLYVRDSLRDVLEPPILDQHSADLIAPNEYRVRTDAKKFENWEQYFAGKYALGKAIDYALSWGMESIQSRVYSIASYLRAKLSEVDSIQLTDEGAEKCGIVTFSSNAAGATVIQANLAAHKINVSVSSGSGNLVSFQQRGLDEVVRASVHYFNTEAEVDFMVDTLRSFSAK